MLERFHWILASENFDFGCCICAGMDTDVAMWIDAICVLLWGALRCDTHRMHNPKCVGLTVETTANTFKSNHFSIHHDSILLANVPSFRLQSDSYIDGTEPYIIWLKRKWAHKSLITAAWNISKFNHKCANNCAALIHLLMLKMCPYIYLSVQVDTHNPHLSINIIIDFIYIYTIKWFIQSFVNHVDRVSPRIVLVNSTYSGV